MDVYLNEEEDFWLKNSKLSKTAIFLYLNKLVINLIVMPLGNLYLLRK